MRKILKYTYLFIVTFVLTFSFKTDVSASCDGYTSKYCRITSNRTIISAGTNYGSVDVGSKYTEDYKNQGINLAESSGISYSKDKSWSTFFSYNDGYSALYCIDPQLEGPAKLYAGRFLLDSTASKKEQIFDYGLISILTDDTNSILKDDSNPAEYFSRLLAIRAFNSSIGFVNSNIEYVGYYYATNTVLNNWLKDSKVSKLYDDLNKKLVNMGEDSLINRNLFGAHTDYYFSEISTSGVLDDARSYYIRALEKAIELADKVTNRPSVNSKVEAGDINSIPTGNDVFVEKDVKHTITVSGISNNGYNSFIINGLKFDNDIEYQGLEYSIKSIKIGSKLYDTPNDVKSVLGKDLIKDLGYDFNSKTEIVITVNFNGWETKYTQTLRDPLKCGQQPISYYIDGTYSVNLYGKYSNYVGTIWKSENPDQQRYIGIEEVKAGEDNSKVEWKSSYQTYLIEACSCDNLKSACISSKNLNSEACQDLKNSVCGECSWIETACKINKNSSECNEERQMEVCKVTCNTEVDNLECCIYDDGEYVLNISDSDNQKVNITGPDPNLCFATAIGESQKKETNPYAKSYELNGYSKAEGVKDDENNSYTSMQNKYCVVSCKEDYIMTMPTAKRVNSGRYFTFKVGINGTKSCYTNKIDISQFNEDITELLEDIGNAFTQYKKYQTVIDYLRNEAKPEDTYIDKTGYCGDYEDTGYFDGYNHIEVPYYIYKFNASLKNGVISSITLSETESKNDYKYTDEYEVKSVTDVDKIVKSSGYVYGFNHMDDGGESDECDISCEECCNCEIVGEAPDTEKVCDDKYACSGGTNGNVVENVIPSLNHYQNYWRQKYNELINKYDNLINAYENCSNGFWTADFIHKNKSSESPDVTYDYQENYYYSKTGTMDLVNNKITYSTENITYCNNGYGDSSECIKNKTTENVSFYEFKEIKTDDNLNNDEDNKNKILTDNYFVKKTKTLPKVEYVKKVSTMDANYKPSTLYYNNYPNGNISINYSSNAIELVNSVPVSLRPTVGVYNYNVNITNLGEFYSGTQKGTVGRLIGDSSSAVLNTDDYNFVKDNKAVYACAYLVNLPTQEFMCVVNPGGTTDNPRPNPGENGYCEKGDCVSNCIGAGCDNICDSDNCVADCIGVGCIYEEGNGLSVYERVVSLNNLFPFGTSSYNWNADENQKALDTIHDIEIENKGNEVYNEQPIFSITIDANDAAQIRKYNDVAEDNNGGYSNETLKCYSLDGNEKAACFSTFITDLIDGKIIVNEDNEKDKIDVTINDSKIKSINDYRVVGNVTSSKSGYFYGWSSVSESKSLGPSWK